MSEWLDIPGWPGYQASRDGRIRRPARWDAIGRFRPAQVRRVKVVRGYPALQLWRDGKYHSRTVHSLIALAFLGPRPPNHEVNHRNGDRLDSAADNLEYVTHRANSLHMCRVLGYNRGERSAVTKLTLRAVLDIRRRVSQGTAARLLAAEYGVSHSTIYNVKHRRVWNHV